MSFRKSPALSPDLLALLDEERTAADGQAGLAPGREEEEAAEKNKKPAEQSQNVIENKGPGIRGQAGEAQPGAGVTQ